VQCSPRSRRSLGAEAEVERRQTSSQRESASWARGCEAFSCRAYFERQARLFARCDAPTKRPTSPSHGTPTPHDHRHRTSHTRPAVRRRRGLGTALVSSLARRVCGPARRDTHRRALRVSLVPPWRRRRAKRRGPWELIPASQHPRQRSYAAIVRPNAIRHTTHGIGRSPRRVPEPTRSLSA